VNLTFRHAVPGALLLLLIPVMGIQGWLRIRSADERVGIQVSEKAHAVGAPVTVAIESALRRGDLDVVRQNLVSCGVDPDLRHAVVVDRGGDILTAADAALEGQSLESLIGPGFAAVAAEARSTLTTRSARDPERAQVLVAFPLRMHDPNGGFFGRRSAAVVMAFDTARTRAAIQQSAGAEFAVGAGGLVTGTFLLWLWLNQTLLSRVRQVVDRLHRLRRGDLDARTGLRGADEISEIGRAVDDMADGLQANTARLQSTEDDLRRALREQQDLLEEVRLLSRRLSRSAEHERQRIARDLHDDLGQDITALRYLLESLRSEMDPATPESQKAVLGQLARTTMHMTDKVRAMLSVLRPAVLHEFGVGPALEALSDQTARVTDATLEFRGDPGRLDPDVEIELYRIAQEATLNAAKHSDAETISASFRLHPDRYELVVTDDGRGFDPDEPARTRGRPRWGLIGIRERTRAIGAELHIEAEPADGTTVRVVGPRATNRRTTASGQGPVAPPS
jgi:two-component system sensor histidine kinase UhpB